MSISVSLRLIQRFSQCAFERPTILETHCQGLQAQPESFSPLHHAKGFAVEHQEAITASIPRLLFLRRPSDIARLIVPVVVDTVNLMRGRRTRAEVRIECAEGSPPQFANRDASPAIVVEGLMVRIGTSIKHTAPDFELGRLPHAMLESSRSGPGGSQFTLPAAAGLRSAGSQVSLVDDFLDAAITTAQPLCSESTARESPRLGAGKNGQATITGAGDGMLHVLLRLQRRSHGTGQFSLPPSL